MTYMSPVSPLFGQVSKCTGHYHIVLKLEDPLKSPPKYSYLAPRLVILFVFTKHLVLSLFKFSFSAIIVKTYLQ